jgi:hypothetical protein
MDNLIKKNINKLNSLKNRYIKLDKSLIDNFKKRLILYDDINSKLNEIEDLMNNFEVNDCNLELQRRIESKKIYEELINMLSPYIIIFMLNIIDYI